VGGGESPALRSAPEVAIHGDKLATTVEEYLEHTRTSSVKYEWVNGQAWAMTGGRLRHQAVATNVVIALGVRLKGRPCRPVNSDQRVYVEQTDNFYYPDASVICGPFQRAEPDPHSIVNPTCIVEVLSPSTRNYDLGGKFEDYRLIPTLRDALFIDPHDRRVIHLARTDQGWLRRDLTQGAVVLTGLDGLALPLDEIYADLEDVPDDE